MGRGMLVLVFVLFAVNPSTPQSNPPLVRVSKCKSTKTYRQASLSTHTLASENNGFWQFHGVPVVPETASLTHAQLRAVVSGGSVSLSLYTQLQGEVLKPGLKLNVVDTNFGISTATPTNNIALGPLKIYYLAYVKMRWAFFYICSDNAPDLGVDYRYVVSHGWTLTDFDKNGIMRFDAINQMRGPMKFID